MGGCGGVPRSLERISVEVPNIGAEEAIGHANELMLRCGYVTKTDLHPEKGSGCYVKGVGEFEEKRWELECGYVNSHFSTWIRTQGLSEEDEEILERHAKVITSSVQTNAGKSYWI